MHLRLALFGWVVVWSSAFASAAPGETVTVWVPGFQTYVTGPVGVPLNATWPMARHAVIEYPGSSTDNTSPGFRFTEPQGNPRDIVFGSGKYEMNGAPFLPVDKFTWVSLFQIGNERFRRGGIGPSSGTADWPAFLNTRAVIWGVDGFAFSNGGSASKNMVQYFAERTGEPYVYIEYYVRHVAECGRYSACQMSLYNDQRGQLYSQAMILPLSPQGAKRTLVQTGTFEAQDQTGARLSRLAGDLLVTGLVAGLTAELSKPVGVQLREARERCEREKAQGMFRPHC